MPKDSYPDVKVIEPGNGTPLNVVGDVVRIRFRGEETGGAYSVIEEQTPPQGGPPPHLHQREDEWFYVVEGELEFRVGDRTIQARTGSHVFAPRGIPHAFKNVGPTPSRVLVTISPPGLERFFVELHELSDGKTPPPLEKLSELAERYGLEILA